jgi:hypothetical protein
MPRARDQRTEKLPRSAKWRVGRGLVNFAGVADPFHGWNKIVACLEGEIIVQVLVTIYVDLRG